MPKIIAVVVGVAFVVFGIWAFFAPESFYETLATFEPFNEHFVRDIGAFQIGLGAVLLLGAYLRDALLVVLTGAAVGSVFHLVGHVIDRDLGGDPVTDIPFFSIMAVALIAGAIIRSRGARLEG
jgi:uncharacterized protein YjeT (DUF2065 family)